MENLSSFVYRRICENNNSVFFVPLHGYLCNLWRFFSEEKEIPAERDRSCGERIQVECM
jgi:hypothetical protein